MDNNVNVQNVAQTGRLSRRRALCVAIAFIFAMSVFAGVPTEAHAADDGLSIEVGGEDLVSGAAMDVRTSQSGVGWWWDADLQTLTLDSDYTGDEIAILTDDSDSESVDLVLSGAGIVKVNGDINSQASLTISSGGSFSGKLAITGGSLIVGDSGSDYDSSLTMDGVNLTVNNTDTAIYAVGDLSISESTVNATSAEESSVIGYGDLSVSESTVNAAGVHYGLYVSGGAVSVDESIIHLIGGREYPAFSSTVPLEIKDVDSSVTLVNATGLTGGRYFPAQFKRPSILDAVWKVTPGSSFLDASKQTTANITVKQSNETAVIELLSKADAEYYLDVKAGFGVASGSGYYNAGETVSIAVAANNGYRFNGWKISAGGGQIANAQSANTTFTMPAGGTVVTAQFLRLLDIAATTSVAAIPDKTQTGMQLKPAVTVKYKTGKLTKGLHYTVTYGENKKVGVGKATITGIGDFTGTKTVKFKIVPKKTTVKKVVPSKKKLKVTWKKISGITKYEIQYRAQGTKAWKKATADAKKTSITLGKLKKGKTYQVRIRSYQKIAGVKYTSPWSSVKLSKKIK